MKSSGPLFTRQNPFPAAKMGKTHYHPTCTQTQSTNKKKTSSIPVRSNQRPAPQARAQRSSASKHSSDKGGCSFTATDGQPFFSESWPSTEDGSSPASTATTSDKQTHKDTVEAPRTTITFETDLQEDSLLARYIERFRHGRPQCREERASVFGEESPPFWWTSPPSLLSKYSPTKEDDKDRLVQAVRGDHVADISSPGRRRRVVRSTSPCRESDGFLSDTCHSDLDDTEILHLQEKASRLLLRGSEHSQSDGSVPVSSDGLGGSDFSPPVSFDEPGKRPLIPGFIKPAAGEFSQKPIVRSLARPTGPEEDILFQWRLRRKMEQARESHSQSQQHYGHYGHYGHTLNWQPSSLLHPSHIELEQPYKQQPSPQPPEFSPKDVRPHDPEAPRPLPPASAPPVAAFVSPGSPHQAVASVPAHTHLLCDVLPCPVQLSHASTQQNLSHRTDEICAKQARVPSEEPIRERASSPCGAAEDEQPRSSKMCRNDTREKTQKKDSGISDKKRAASNKKPKKSSRCAVNEENRNGHGAPSEKGLRKKEAEQKRRSSSESRAVDRGKTPSPVQKALAQAVSETLFPTVDASPAQTLPNSALSPPSPKSTVPERNAHTSAEVIAQLLQETEDSDGKEFEDDSLLRVLRKQRKWVKEQIREVETLLTEFLDERHVT